MTFFFLHISVYTQGASESKDVILIAYTYLKTVRYLQCLAAGIPCIMHTWIIECCRKNQLLKRDSYVLPSGYSIINRNLPSDKYVLPVVACFCFLDTLALV